VEACVSFQNLPTFFTRPMFSAQDRFRDFEFKAHPIGSLELQGECSATQSEDCGCHVLDHKDT
jgi:hypothetical protein